MSANPFRSIEERAAADLSTVSTIAAKRQPAPPPGQEAPPEVQLLRGDTIKPEPIRWLWEGWLARGKLHILAGAPGTGKSTIAFKLAAAITAGRFWPDGKRAAVGNVLIWSGEDDPADTILPRLLGAGADPTRVYIVKGTVEAGQSRPFDPATDMEALRHQAALIDGIALLIADPIVSAVSGDSHKNTEVRRALQPLVDLGAMLGCAVLGISHFSKGSAGRDPVERVTGSIAFAALARIVLATAKPEEGPRVLARAKSNIGPDGGGITYAISVGDVPGHPGVTASAIEWLEAVEGSARELLGAAEEAPDRDDEGEDVVDWLRDLLAGGVTPAKAVQAAARECGYTDKQLRRAREKLGVRPRKGAGEGPTAPWYWSLPDHAKVPADSQDDQAAQPASVGTMGNLAPFIAPDPDRE